MFEINNCASICFRQVTESDHVNTMKLHWKKRQIATITAMKHVLDEDCTKLIVEAMTNSWLAHVHCQCSLYPHLVTQHVMWMPSTWKIRYTHTFMNTLSENEGKCNEILKNYVWQPTLFECRAIYYNTQHITEFTSSTYLLRHRNVRKLC